MKLRHAFGVLGFEAVPGRHRSRNAAVIVSQRWRPLTAHLNGEALRTRAGALGFFGGVIIEGPSNWAVRPVAEIFIAGDRQSPTTTSELLGAILTLSNTLSLDLAGRVAERGGAVAYEIRIGLTWGTQLWGKS